MKNLKILIGVYSGMTKRAKALLWFAGIVTVLIIFEFLSGCSLKF
jgi:uncharacterized membrane protein YjdF